MNLFTFGTVEEEVLNQMKTAMEKSNAAYGVLCADNHLGYSVPVGGVIGIERGICVNGVGYDIACGNKAVRLDCDSKTVREGVYRNMNEIQHHISFGVGRKNNEKVDHPIFDDPAWDELDLLRGLRDKARDQLGSRSVENSEDGEIHDTVFIKVITDKGCFKICSHNTHNGYYGGFYISIKVVE